MNIGVLRPLLRQRFSSTRCLWFETNSMRTTITLSLGLLVAAATAQCTFDPTVTPNNLILCPNTQDVLSTQVYDSYQWYKDGGIIPGAIAQTLTVDAFTDAGSMFNVEATLNGCTEMSPSVLVDGWLFLPPYVIHEGAVELYTDSMGIEHYCGGDTVLLIFSFTENVQWTNNGVPIPGATNDTLVVLGSGNYTVSGAPAMCPNSISPLGLTIPILFDIPIQPVITQNGNQLCASPAGISYQWTFNGIALLVDQVCINGGGVGSYVVDVTYNPDCSIPSEPFMVTSIPTAIAAPWLVQPTPANEYVTITASSGAAIGDWQLLDITGRVVRQGKGNGATSVSARTADLPTGRYWFNPKDATPLAVSVVH